MAFARDRLRTMFLTARSSITITSWSGPGGQRCGAGSRRGTARTLRCARATFALALARFADPRWQRATALVAGEVPFPASQVPRVGIFSPSRVTAKSLMPRSTPRMRPVAGSCSGSATSTANDTYQRPHGSRETVTVVGSIDAGSMSGHDHTNASGVSILARNNAPSRYRNPDRVYSADCPPLRDLTAGSGPAWRRSWCTRPAGAGSPAAAGPRTPRSARPGPGRASWRSNRHWPG